MSTVLAEIPCTPARPKLRPLPEGGTIAIPSPASPVLDPHSIPSAQEWLEGLGYTVRFTERFNRRWGYAAGRPEERARDLEDAFADPEIDAIVCLGGGHATNQILRLLDYDLIAANPKPFVGFSDITNLHAAIAVEAGFATFWGPMFSQLGYSGAFNRESLLRALTRTEPLGVVDPHGPPARCIVGGVAEAELTGGTIQILSTLLGTPWEPDTRGKIVLLEEVGEEPCRVHRTLMHLLNAGKLDGIAGLCLSEFERCGPKTILPAWSGPSLELEDVLAEVLAPLGVPAMYGLPLGHGPQLATVPLGVRVRLDATAGRLEILESPFGRAF